MYDEKQVDIRPEGQSKMQAPILELAEYIDADDFGVSSKKLSPKSKENERKKAKKRFQAANEAEIKKAGKDAKTIIGFLRAPKNNEITANIKALLKKHGMKLVTRPYEPISKAEKKVIRMDFYGTIDKPKKEALSRFYKYFREKFEPDSDKVKDFSHKYKKEDYNLYDCPSWSLFRQFHNFRKIEQDVVDQIQRMGIPPECLTPISKEDKEILKRENADIKDLNTLKPAEMADLLKKGLSMNAFRKLAVEDFSDIIYLGSRVDKSRNSASIFESSRQQFIKDFINKCEKPFRMILEAKEVHPVYIDALVKSMREKGVTDIAPTDKENKPIDGPKFSDHHLLAVNMSFYQFYLAKSNFKANQLLCMDKLNQDDEYNLHFDLLHGVNNEPYTGPDGKKYQDAIEFENPNIVFWGGLSHIEQISYDYENDSRTQKLSDNVRLPAEYEFITNEASYAKKPENEAAKSLQDGLASKRNNKKNPDLSQNFFRTRKGYAI